MLGVHPQLYTLPEVNLFCGDTVADLFSIASQKGMTYMTHGLLRVLAELHGGCQTKDTVEEAYAWLERRQHWSVKRMYLHICEEVSPRRCVDKSPPYSRPENIRRILDAFPDALFLHLGRHPRSACMSTFKALSDRWQRRGRELDPNFVEQRWAETHARIFSLSEKLHHGQYFYIQGEMLLSEPVKYLEQIAEWLGVSTDPQAIEAMLHPENSPYACVGPDNARGGNNRGFLENPHLRISPIRMPAMSGRLEWFPEGDDHEFSAETREIAAMLGYV